MTCRAKHRGDQMMCDECGLVWDVNDPDPPECGGKTDTLTGLALRDVLERKEKLITETIVQLTNVSVGSFIKDDTTIITINGKQVLEFGKMEMITTIDGIRYYQPYRRLY